MTPPADDSARADSPISAVTTPEALPGPPERAFGRWYLRAFRSPIQFLVRRPGRAALWIAVLLLSIGFAAAVSARVWFEYQLRGARKEVAIGHNAAAVRYLDRCRQVRPDDREVLFLSARVARRAGSWDEAERIINYAMEVYGEPGEMVLELLLLRVARGEIETVGGPVLARIREGGPDTAIAREALITGLIYRFRWAEANRYLQEWLDAEPNSTSAQLLKGKLDEQRLAQASAKATYLRILELDPDHDEARLRLTSILLAEQRADEAITHLEHLRRRLPNHPEVAVQWARALSLLGRSEESRVALAECIRDHPNYPPALGEYGSQLLLAGNEVEAEQYLARAVSMEPGNVVTRNRYALALARNGKRAEMMKEEASIAALKADMDRISILISGPLQERPNDPEVHFEIAQIALRSGQVREALQWFTSALRVDPGHVPTHRALSFLYRELDNPVLSARHRALAQRSDRIGKQ